MRGLLVALCLLAAWSPLTAQERVLGYHSRIVVDADGSMEVTETIRVRAEGREIRRGIYRDFPTRYRDRLGNRVVVDFQPLEVLRDGRPEPWFTERRPNGVRVNTGDDRFLEVPAEIEYTLRYRTSRQLGFFDGHDELYWNVTGLGWAFAIEQASAEVVVPGNPADGDLDLQAFTGPAGARDGDFMAKAGNGAARFVTTRPLAPGEGLTIVVGFPKGLVEAPTRGERLAWLLRDNLGVLVALAGFLPVLVFYVMRWRRIGRDPAAGPLFPRYQPPEGHSPGGLRYLRRMGHDTQAFTADLVDLAVQGHVEISQGEKRWSLRRLDPGGAPARRHQHALLDALLPGTAPLELHHSNASTVQAAQSAHRKALEGVYTPRFFVNNGATIAIGVLWWVVVSGLSLIAALATGGAGLPLVAAIGALGILAHLVFGVMMKARTVEGRALLDEVEGLRLYLGVAEQRELAGLSGPGTEPALDAGRYERLLPFAIALDVEEAWTRRFTVAVGAAAAAAAAAGMHWYHGRGPVSDLGSMTRSISSTLNSQISSASSPPGSSSGGGGGGFSGGGGGGGGGGGR